MSATSDDAKTTVDVYLRAGGSESWRGQQRVIDDLERYERDGVIDHFRIQVWGRAVSLSGPMARTRFHRSAVETVREFERWAEDCDRPVELPFDRESVESEFTGEQYHLLRPPTVCLALHRGEELTAVFPCQAEEETCSVPDLLACLDGEDSSAAAFLEEVAPTSVEPADAN